MVKDGSVNICGTGKPSSLAMIDSPRRCLSQPEKSKYLRNERILVRNSQCHKKWGINGTLCNTPSHNAKTGGSWLNVQNGLTQKLHIRFSWKLNGISILQY